MANMPVYQLLEGKTLLSVGFYVRPQENLLQIDGKNTKYKEQGFWNIVYN